VVKAVRGMRDILPEQSRRWRLVEDTLAAVLTGHAYEEIRLPYWSLRSYLPEAWARQRTS